MAGSDLCTAPRVNIKGRWNMPNTHWRSQERLGMGGPRGQSLATSGTCTYSWGQYQRAVDYYEKGLGILRNIGDVKAEGHALGNLGNVYCSWGQYQKAVDYYEKGFGIFRNIGDVKAEGLAFGAIGHVYCSWGQYQKAVDYYEKGLEIARKIGDVETEGDSLINLGSVYARLGESGKAQAHFEKGLGIAQKIGVPDARPKNLLAGLFMDQGALDNAEPWIKAAGYQTTWGRYYLLKLDHKKAQEYYSNILKSAEQSRHADLLFTAYTGLGTAYEGLGVNASASRALREGSAAYRGDQVEPQSESAGILL